MPTQKVILRRKQMGLCPNCGSPEREIYKNSLCEICYVKGQERSKAYRISNPDIKHTISARMVERQLLKCRTAKQSHKNSSQCSRKKRRCTACHFWSGAISILSELLGFPGVID